MDYCQSALDYGNRKLKVFGQRLGRKQSINIVLFIYQARSPPPLITLDAVRFKTADYKTLVIKKNFRNT